MITQVIHFIWFLTVIGVLVFGNGTLEFYATTIIILLFSILFKLDKLAEDEF